MKNKFFIKATITISSLLAVACGLSACGPIVYTDEPIIYETPAPTRVVYTDTLYFYNGYYYTDRYYRHRYYGPRPIPRPYPYHGGGHIQPGPAPYHGGGHIQPGPAPYHGGGHIQPGPAPYHGGGHIQPGAAPYHGGGHIQPGPAPKKPAPRAKNPNAEQVLESILHKNH